MKLRINQLLCIFMFFGVFPLQGYARSNTPETEIQALVKEADSCRMNNNLYRALKLYEEAYQREASTETLRAIIQCHYERGDVPMPLHPSSPILFIAEKRLPLQISSEKLTN